MSLHYLHKRKRQSGGSPHPYPANSGWVRFLDKVVFVAAILGPAMSVPQVWVIFANKTADGIAPITWISLAVLNIPWIIYGIAHKEKVITFNTTLWLIINTAVFVGAVLY